MASNLNVTELDFNQIKDNLKNFLKQQSEFNEALSRKDLTPKRIRDTCVSFA